VLQAGTDGLFGLAVLLFCAEDHAQTELRRSVAAVAQLDGSLESALRVGIALQVQVGQANFVVRLVKVRENFDGVLKLSNTLGRFSLGKEVRALIEEFAGFLRNLQFARGNLAGGIVRELWRRRGGGRLPPAHQRTHQKDRQAC
jgi:hypothetical protein